MSEVIGYTMLFALVIGATVIGALVGIQALGQVGEETSSQVGVNNFETIRSNNAEIADGAPYRVSELKPTEATFTYGADYTVNITAQGGGVDLTGSDAIEISATELVQQTGDKTNVTYASGMIATAQIDGVRAVVQTPPLFRLSDRQAVFTLPLTYRESRSSGYITAADNGRFPVLAERTDQSVTQRIATDGSGNPTTMTGTINITGSSVPGGWKTYFSEQAQFKPTQLDGTGGDEYAVDTDGDGTAEIVGAEFTTERIYVQHLDIAISYDTGL